MTSPVDWTKKGQVPGWLTALIAGSLLGLGAFGNFHVLYTLDPVEYTVTTIPVGMRSWATGAVFWLGAVILEFLVWQMLARRRGNFADRAFFMATLPLVGAGAACFLPGLWMPVVFTAAVSWSVFRQALLLSGRTLRLLDARHANWWRLAAGMLAIYLVGTGYHRQMQLLSVMGLYFHDWGLFLDVARNLWEGRGFITNETGLNFLGNHFMPLSIVLLLPFAAWCDGPELFFFFNAALLTANAALIYALARTLRQAPSWAAIWALITLFLPSLSNLVLAQRYGFHENYFFMPLLTLFFLLWSRGKCNWALGVALASFLLKETIPVVWGGVGLVWWLSGERRRGALLLGVSIGYFLLVTKVVMPYFQGGGDYRMLFVFANLGDSFWEVVFSPVLRPRVFWGTLLAQQTWLFAALLLLPVWMVTLARPRWLLAAVLPFVFVAVQEGVWLRNIVSQHHADFLMIIVCNGVLALAALRRGAPGKWERLLAGGLPAGCLAHGEKRAAALLLGTLVGAGLSFYFFAQGIHGKYSFHAISAQAIWTDEMGGFKALIPPGTELNASMAPAAHFVLRNKVYPNSFYFHYLSGRVLLDLFSEYEDQQRFDQVRGHLLSNGYRVIHRVEKDGRLLVLLTREGEAMPDHLALLSREQFAMLGDRVPQTYPGCEVRVRREADRFAFFIRLERQLDCDLQLQALLIGSQGEVTGNKTLFSGGVTPAFLAPPGATMTLYVDIPSEWDGVRQAGFKVTPRPEIERKNRIFTIKENWL